MNKFFNHSLEIEHQHNVCLGNRLYAKNKDENEQTKLFQRCNPKMNSVIVLMCSLSNKTCFRK